MASEEENIVDEITTSIAYKIAFETDNAMAGYIERICVEQDSSLEKYKFNAKKIAAALKKDMPIVPYEDENRYFCCPVCGQILGYRLGSLQQTLHNLSWINYCWICGQKLNWEYDQIESTMTKLKG